MLESGSLIGTKFPALLLAEWPHLPSRMVERGANADDIGSILLGERAQSNGLEEVPMECTKLEDGDGISPRTQLFFLRCTGYQLEQQRLLITQVWLKTLDINPKTYNYS